MDRDIFIVGLGGLVWGRDGGGGKGGSSESGRWGKEKH